MVDNPGSLSQIVEYQSGLDKSPRGAYILQSAVSEVRIECFRTSGTQEDSPHHDKHIGHVHQKMDGIVGVESPQYPHIACQLAAPHDAHHGKPQHHVKSEILAQRARAERLDHEYQKYNDEG